MWLLTRICPSLASAQSRAAIARLQEREKALVAQQANEQRFTTEFENIATRILKVRFGDPGWRLGYTKDAVSSHFVFRQLQKEGVIPQGVRFQVCLPLTFSAIGLFFPDPADHAKMAPGVTAAFRGIR
jgi:hypothetical protein